jgi:hypothetical protein
MHLLGPESARVQNKDERSHDEQAGEVPGTIRVLRRQSHQHNVQRDLQDYLKAVIGFN